MKKIPISAWLCAALVAPLAWAQTQDGPAGPASAATSRAPATSLGSYRPYADPPIAPWLQSNAQVARKGGWKAYAREASQQDDANAPAAPSPANAGSSPGSPSAPEGKPAAPHGGHAH